MKPLLVVDVETTGLPGKICEDLLAIVEIGQPHGPEVRERKEER